MRLTPGSRVMIVGGGPAGSFSALHLLKEAKAVGLRLEVTVFEGRDFSKPGPSGCNKCAGVLSSNLVAQMHALGLDIPASLVLAVLNSYVLHFGRQTLKIERGEVGPHVLSVYRGSGPRLGEASSSPSFDDWLLDQVRQNGGTVVRRHAERVIPGPRPVVVSAGQPHEADLVIVATGVNSRSPLDPTWGYTTPECEVMAQNEISRFGTPLGDSVHIYFSQPAGLLFGALVPKGNHVNISLLGENLPPKSIERFLESHQITADHPEALPGPPPLLCGCAPRVAIGPAQGYYADRMVVVGDAAATRLYKNGIGSAYATAAAAARCALQHGVSAEDFAMFYSPTCAAITSDNRFGRLLFTIWKQVRDRPVLRRRWQNALRREGDSPPQSQVHRSLLWHMFTGDRSYAQIFRQAVSGRSLWELLKGGK